jgi:hypothetical protein
MFLLRRGPLAFTKEITSKSCFDYTEMKRTPLPLLFYLIGASVGSFILKVKIVPMCFFSTEDNDDVDDDGNQVSTSNGERRGPKRGREVQKNLAFMDGLVAGVTQVTHPTQLSQIQRRVQDISNWTGYGRSVILPFALNVCFLSVLDFLGRSRFPWTEIIFNF